jgi:divalent metal cation (Fe/Co/Zn/Cd) transporter
VHNVNIYLLAKEIHIDLDLEVADHLSLAEAHKRSEELEEALRRELTGRVQIAVHLEPRSDDARPAVRRLSSAQEIRDVLSKLPQAANVRVHDVLLTEEGLVVTLKENFGGEMSLRKTHDVMTDLERTLKLSIPGVVRVHVDPEISKVSPTLRVALDEGD